MMSSQPRPRRSSAAATGNNCHKRLHVFDFTEEDERVENESKKFARRFGDHVAGSSSAVAVDKYSFIRCFARGAMTQQKKSPIKVIDVDDQRKIEPVRVIDVEDGTRNGDEILEKRCSGKLSDSNGNVIAQRCIDLSSVSSPKGASRDRNSGLATCVQSMYLKNADQVIYVISDEDSERLETSLSTSTSSLLKDGVSPKLQVSSCGLSGHGFNEAIYVISDDYHVRMETISSGSSPSLAENEVLLGERASERGSGGHEIDAVNKTVFVFPDVIIYGDIYCTKSRLTFSCSRIKVECSAVNATEETFSCLWAIEDIINIEWEWCLMVETAVVNVLLKSKDSKGAGTANEYSGVELLRFAVYDPSWSTALEAIKLLDARYKDKWNVVFDLGGETVENACVVHTSKSFFSNSIEPFEEIIYPRGDPDAVSISKRDTELLLPERFINDTIIDFYIKYLKKTKIQPEKQQRFHFFNSFFFRKLANLDEGPSDSSDGREAFQRVRKWTRNVDVFGKDYIFIPVNYSLHWSLIAICHPGEVANLKDNEAEKSPRIPCILHMDSIKGSHRGLKSLFQKYLCEEWKERHAEKTDDIPLKFLDIRFISLELPQQQNSYDCGLFLLHYVERFIAEAPDNFRPSDVSESSNFLSRNWFPPAEASSKRGYIWRLLYRILEEHPRNVHSADCSNRQPSSDKNKQEAEVEFLTEIRCSTKPFDGYSSMSNAARQNETSTLAAYTPPALQHIRNSGELLGSRISRENFSTENYQPLAARHQRTFMSPVEEVEESVEQGRYWCSPLEIVDCEQMSGQAYLLKTSSLTSKDFRCTQTSCNRQRTLHIEESDEQDTISLTSSCESQNSSEIQEDLPLDSAEFGRLHKTGKLASPSTSSRELNDFVVEDSLEAVGMHDDSDSKDSASSLNTVVLIHQEERLLERNNTREKDAIASKRDALSEPMKEGTAKRTKSRAFTSKVDD